jgi:hypothetical protein
MPGVQHEYQSLKSRGSKVLTEQEVSRSWARLFKGEKSSEAFSKAEALLDELRPESPLRHRLGCELDEIREMSLQEK